MIRFPCHCKHVFEVDDDQAGMMIQCPACGRLNDIPTLSERDQIDEEGIFKLLDPDPPASRSNVDQAIRAFTRDRTTERGDDIDLRLSYDDLMHVGEPVVAPGDVHRAGGFSPKYDPFTGELIRPIEVKADVVPNPTIPLEQPPARSKVIEVVEPSMGGVFVHLLQPSNLFVLLAVLLIHGLIEIVGAAARILFFLLPVQWFLVALLMSHYGCVLEETGSSRNDEMPRPLRDLGWQEDLWGPFKQVLGSLVLCFVPAWLVMYHEWFGDFSWVGALGLAGIGCFFAPAVLITMTTSGSSLNLRPDRLFSVIRGIGARYGLLVVMFVISMTVYVVGYFAVGELWAGFFAPPGSLAGHVPVMVILLPLGVYLTHAFCWMCGLAYRRGYEHFDWVLQRHISTRQEEEAQRRAEALARLNANSARAKERLT